MLFFESAGKIETGNCRRQFHGCGESDPLLLFIVSRGLQPVN
jgi:hypothetical protein